MLRERQAFALLFLFRFACSLLVRYSFFNPDEYWQSLEVAHQHVFGYGHLTWEWKAGLRSYLYPFLYMVPYKLLALVGLDTTLLLDTASRLLGALVAACCDSLVYYLTLDLFGRSAASWALILQLCSWFNAYCLTRSYVNCLEALALLFVLYRWPVPAVSKASSTQNKNRRSPWLFSRLLAFSRRSPSSHSKTPSRAPPRSRTIVPSPLEISEPVAHRTDAALCTLVMTLAFVARPTLAPPFLAIWLHALLTRPDLTLRRVFQGGSLAAAALGLTAAALLDCAFYGRWVFPPWEFFKFNLLGGGAAQYGVHPIYWNFTQGFPAVLASFLPLALFGYLLLLFPPPSSPSLPPRARLFPGVLCTAILPYDLAAHKEFRFLLPTLQLLTPLCGHTLATLQAHASPRAPSPSKREPGSKASSRLLPAWLLRTWGRTGRLVIGLLLAVQVGMVAYFGLVHQTGTTRVMTELERHIRTDMSRDVNPSSISVLLAMPCHATPLYSWMHLPVRFRFPDCSPQGYRPGGASANTAPLTETDAFIRQPLAYVAREVVGRGPGSPPHYIVMFDRDWPAVTELLAHKGYDLATTVFHAHLEGDHGPQNRVLIFRRQHGHGA